LGRRPSAAAWSPSAEERRKALLACLAEGVATLVWDNIERGTAISCPSIEKALTSAEYSDRVLGSTRTMTVPSTTVLAFTGNNIAPKGDMASRSLVCRLELERPDPENRSFRHDDPVRWTLDNRQRILQCLYTLLRWNPQTRVPRADRAESKTRFKAWWDLVGAPLETASLLAAEAQARVADQGAVLFHCAPEAVDFGTMFVSGEAEDEETCGMQALVLLLRSAFGDRLFSATHVASLLQPSGNSSFGLPADPEALEQIQAARAALEGATGKPLPPVVTTHIVGKRLQMLVGRPVALATGDVAMVTKARDHHEAHAYRVSVTEPAF
jgi:hypothetical protein